MTNTIYTLFEDELLQEGIDNKYYLQGLLRDRFDDEWLFRRDYISKDPNYTTLERSIIEFIRKSPYPVQLKAKLTGQDKEKEEKLAEIDVTKAPEGKTASIAPAQKKKSKAGIIVILLLLLIAAAIYLIQSGMLGNTTTGDNLYEDSEQSVDQAASTQTEAENKDVTLTTEGYGRLTSGELRSALLERFKSKYEDVVDLSAFQASGFGELTYTVDDATVIVRTQMPGEAYDENSPIDYCVIYTDKNPISSELAALVVNEVYKAFDYEKSKSVIEELLKSSEESTTDDSQIQMEGNEYDEGNIYCAYQPDLNIVIIFPPDLDIYDIMTWSNIQ